MSPRLETGTARRNELRRAVFRLAGASCVDHEAQLSQLRPVPTWEPAELIFAEPLRSVIAEKNARIRKQSRGTCHLVTDSENKRSGDPSTSDRSLRFNELSTKRSRGRHGFCPGWQIPPGRYVDDCVFHQGFATADTGSCPATQSDDRCS